MSFTDPISDMITRIRNAQLRTLNTVSIPNSKFRAKILDVLKQEGYIIGYKQVSDSKNKSACGILVSRGVLWGYPIPGGPGGKDPPGSF